jgi:hypothetical protein
VSAADALKAARAVGVSIKLDGGDLVMKAAKPPPAGVLAALKRHKADIVKLLRPPPPTNVFAEVFTALERRCPEYVDQVHWHQAVEDGQRFLATWGSQAEALGWTPTEVFGLHTPPTRPHPSYDRLSRYDDKGLVWLLEGKPVVAMSSSTAPIQHKTGAITNYRKLNNRDWGRSPTV